MSSSSVCRRVWPWREGPSPEKQTKEQRRLGVRALVQACVMAAIGAVLLVRSHLTFAAIIFGLGALALLSALLAPGLFRKSQELLRGFGRLVGLGLTWLLLVPFYLLVFVPARICLKLRGIDPMCRKFPSGKDTDWTPRGRDQAADHYSRQF